MILVIDCCIRGELSSTRRLLNAFLEKFAGESQIRRLILSEQALRPMDNKELLLRNRLLSDGRYEHELFGFAKEFAAADKIIIAAPYWDLSFPSMLKVYLEKVAVTGVTFGYEGERSVGYCEANRIVLLSTAGGFISGGHLGAQYIKDFAAMLGVTDFSSYAIEGLDIDPSKREQLLADGIKRILSAAEF